MRALCPVLGQEQIPTLAQRCPLNCHGTAHALWLQQAGTVCEGPILLQDKYSCLSKGLRLY
jgi:hypothetical protein